MRLAKEYFDKVKMVLQEIENTRKTHEIELRSFKGASTDFYIAPELINNFIPLLKETIKACLRRERSLEIVISNLTITSKEANFLLMSPFIKHHLEDIINEYTDDADHTYSPRM